MLPSQGAPFTFPSWGYGQSMAPPTISSVSPSTGPAAGGQLVLITGTNFKTPTLRFEVPLETVITPTVAVTIGGRAVKRVDVLSSTQVRVLTDRFWHADPRIDAFDPVDVVLTNLADDGVTPLPGQSIVKADAYTYKRWELGAPRQDSPAARILKELVQSLAVEVERNTYVATHVDYGEEGSGILVDEAALPSIGISVNVQRDTEFAQFDNTWEEIEQLDGSFKLYKGARTLQLVCDLMIAATGVNEALHLCQAVQDWVQVNPMLTTAADPTLYAGLEDEYPVELWGEMNQVGYPSESGTIVFSMQLRIRGIRTLPDDAQEQGQTIETVTASEMHMDADGEDDGGPVHIDLVEP